MPRRGVLISVWMLATAAATLIAWAAVSQVTEQVAPQAVLPLPRTAAIAGLSPSEAPSSEAAVAQRDEQGDERSRRRQRNQPGEQVSPAPAANAAQQDPAEAEAQTDAQPEDEPEDQQAVPADGDPEPEPQEQAAPVTEAYDLVGGVVTVRYSGSSATLVEASPESGFVTDVNDGGPGKVDVRFRSDDHESRLVTRIRDGEPDPQREERSR